LSLARDLIRAGRLREAQGALAPLSGAAQAEAHHLRGVIARLEGRFAEAEAQFRAAIALAPAFEDAALELARLCNASGRYREAIVCTRASAATARPAQALLVERARAWQALDRPDERLKAREQIADLYPPTASTLHNLAAALGDAGHATRGEAAVRQAMALGGDAPETWLVLARVLQSQNRFSEADAAFSEALKRRPGYPDALRDRAQLLWMTTGDVEQALLQKS
jgi:tetratricopeptide (TPR) repeat protein